MLPNYKAFLMELLITMDIKKSKKTDFTSLFIFVGNHL
jgi:hypothetical protein